ncbi:hypothetical protein WA026_008958 [Henosepilachna vigintioctopunctata]|uniref:Zinc finger protein Rlf/292/654 TPR repeats domain-containing protein n=1 Tax=Henosepilachna vigintioctopunctata TaxID=420089 RepID=A0AAW1VBP7_9CUCU
MRSENYVCVQKTDVNMATQGDDNKVVCSTNVNKELERNLITLYKKFDVILNNKNESFTRQSESIVEVWHCLTKCKFEKSDLDYAIQIMDWAKLNTLNIVLAGEWKKYKGQYQDALLKEVKATQNQLKKVHSMFDTRCQKLLIVINNPWSDPTLEYLVRTPNAEIGPKEIEFFCVETAYLIAVRLKKLCESQCEDLALNLVKAFMKCYRQQQLGNFNLNATETQVWFIFDMHVALLYKFKENDSLLEMLKGVSAEEGLNIITRFANKRVEISKIWKHCHRIAILAAKVYISSTILKPIDEIQGILRELLRVYVLLNNSEEFLKDVVESVRSIIRLAETAAHIYIFCDVFQEQFETKMKTFIIELYIRALTTDMNLLERQKSDNEKDKLVETSRRLANGFTNLAEVLKGDVNVSRECILTAFSLQPTTDRMKKIEELAKVSGLEVLDTGQEWKCKLHPPILPSDDVAWICTSCGEYMCKPQLNVPLNTNIALNEALTEEKLGITRELCDDLVVLLSCPRYQVFSWLLDWPDLQRLCVMYLNDPERTKNFVTELKFLDIDYSMFVNIKKEPLDEYAGIERGYEHYLDHEFNSDDDQISCASEDTASQESRFFNLGCDSASDLFCLPGVPKKSDPNTLKSLRLFRPSLKRSRNNAESTVVPEKVLKSDLADFAIPCSSKQTDIIPPVVNSSKPSNVTLEIDSANISNQYFLPIQGYTKGSLNSFSSLETRPTAAPAMKPLFSSQNIAQPIKTYANQFNHNNHLDSTYYKAYPGKSATTNTNQTAAPQLNCDISRVPSIGNPKNGQVATLQQVGEQVAVEKSPTKMPMDSGLILGSHNTSNNSEFQQPQTADTTSRQIRESPQQSTILCQNKPPSLAIVNLLDSPSSVVTSKMDVESTVCRNVRDTDEFRYVNSEALENISLNMDQDIANRAESDISEPTSNSSQANICENKTDVFTDVVKSDCDLPSISDRRDQFTHGVPNLFEDFETEYLEPTPSEHLLEEMLELEETRYAIPNLKSYSRKKNNLEKNFVKTRTKTKASAPQFSHKKDDDQLNISLEDNTAGYADTFISSESEYDYFSETNPILQNVLSKIDSFEKEIVIAVKENKPGPSNYGDKGKSVATKIKSKGKGCTISPSDHYNKETEPGPSNYKGKGKSIAKEIKHKGKGCTKKRGKSRSRREPKYESYPDTGSDSQVDVDSDDQFNRCYIELFKNNLLYDTIEGVCKNIDFYLKSKSKCTSSDSSSKRGKEIKKSIPSKKNRKTKIKNTSEKTVLDVGSKSKPKSDIPMRDIRVIINRIPEAILRSLQPVQNDFPVLDMNVLGSTNSASPRSNEENSNVLHGADNEGDRAPELTSTNPGSIANVSPVSIATINNMNQDSTRSNGFRDADRENNNIPKGLIRSSERCDNDSPVSIIAIDDADEDLTRSNEDRSNGLRKADVEYSRLSEVTIRISEHSDNDSPVSIVSIDDSHEDLTRCNKGRTNGLRDSNRKNKRLPEVTVRASECINLDSPVSVVVLCDSDNDSPRSKKEERINSYNAGKDVSADNGSPKSNTKKACGLRDADKENNNVLPDVLVRSCNRIDNDSPLSVEVIEEKDNCSPRSNKEKVPRNDSEEINRFSEILVGSFRRINNDSPASVVVIDDTDNDSPKSNNENSNGLRNVVEENGLSEILLSSSRRIDNDSPASVVVIDDVDNGSAKSNKEKANVRNSSRTDNDSPVSVVVIGDSDNDSPRSKNEQANVSRNTHKWKGKTIKISDADKENSGLPVAFMRSSGRMAIYTPASEILVLDESDNDSPRSNKGSPNVHRGAGKENSSSLNSSLSPESTVSKEDGNVYNSACDILVNLADNPKSDQNQNIGCTTKTTCNKNDILSGNFPNVRNNSAIIRPDDSKDGTVEGETSKVSAERLSVNDSSYVRSVLANIPGLHDTELIRPTNTNMVVNVVQIAGGRNNASVPVANAQTSTQVTPHIQRIGQPRFEKPQNDQPDNGSPIVTSVATSVSSSVKPSTSQPSTLINILSQQVIRPGQSNYARTRPSPLINIVSHQIIRPSTQVVPKMTTTSAQTNEQVNDAPKSETPSEQPASTIVTPAVKNIATTVKTAASVASSPAPGTILQFICKSATLPKFQQAFGKTVYHANNVETTDATSSGENSNSSSDTNKKPPVKSSTVNIQPLQGSVIYTRQVPVGQAINLIPPGRQVFRIATSNPDQISLVKDSVIHSKMSALLTAALQGKKTTEVVEGDGNDNVERVTVTRPTLVQSARIVKPVIQIPSNVIRTNTNTQSNLSSTTLEQLREFDMVYKQIKERSNTGTTPSESSTQSESENPPHGISVTYLNQGQKFTQLSPVVVVSSYCNLQPAASPALSVTSQGSSSPCVTPAPTPTLPKVSTKTSSKGKSLKNASTHISKSSPVPKPQQKPQEDEHTTQRIFDILAEYAEQLRNSPDLNNKPAPRRRSNPPTNPNHNSKRKKSSGSKKPSTTGSAISESDLEDQRTIGSEDSSCGIVQLSVKDEEQVQNQRTESNDSTTSTRPLILTETNSNSTTRNLIIADSSVGEALKLQNTAVLVPGNYIMPVSMVKGGQQIAVVSGGSKILATVPARSGPNMLLFQSFLNQNRKPGVPTVKYSTLQPISGISSQNLASVSGQSSVILPQTTHNLTAVTLGQPLTLKKIEDSDNRVNTELLLAIAQPRESTNVTENSSLPDSSTSIQNSNSIKLDVNNVRINNSSEKIYTYQKSPITAPIATPVISQTAHVENGSDDTTSAQPSIITLNIAADNKDGASRTAKRVQSVLVAACTSNGPMLSHTPPRYRKASESTPINSEVNLKGAYLHNGEKQKDEHKHFQTTAVYFPTKTKKSVSHPAKLDRELHQLCLQRKQAAIERELRLQKSLSEECEDLGVDEPSTSDLFPEADLLFDSNHSPSFDQTSQDVVRKAMHPDKDKSIMLFSDDDNSSSLRTDFLFDSVQYQTEGELQYEQSRQLTNGQSSTSNESGSSCEDNTLLQNCASMSDVTLNSPISPEFTDNPTHMNKYKFKYSNRKKAERHKQVETWTASGEVSSSEDTMCSELGKIVHSPKGCVIKRGSHSSSCDEDEEFKVVRIAISKTDLAKDDESCEELHYDDDLDSPSSGRGARRSVKKMCSCCNGAQEGNRKRPSSRPHTPALHKKAFLNKKR